MRHLKLLAGVALLLLVAALVAKAVMPTVRPHAPPEVNEARRFASTSHPALELSVPSEWKLSYDADRRSLRAVAGPDVENAAVLLDITSDLSEAEVNMDAFQEQLRRTLGEQGFESPSTLSTVSIGGSPAKRFVARKPGETAELCSWHVRRERRYAAHLTCVARHGGCIEACEPALAGLTWLTPADIASSDLR